MATSHRYGIFNRHVSSDLMRFPESTTMTTTFRMQLSCQICVVSILAATAGQGLADGMVASKLFGSVATGSRHQPTVVGSYAQGCIGGAVELPETGPTWQAMRLERNRNWGHPELIDYVVKLSGKAAENWDGRGSMSVTWPSRGEAQ